jgi:pullulanase/glycogen debranching enzyme
VPSGWGRDERRRLGGLPAIGRRVPQRHDSFLLLFNTDPEPIEWTLPKQWGQWWQLVTDTADPGRSADDVLESSATMPVAGRSVVVLRHRDAPE